MPVPAATPWDEREQGGDCAYGVCAQREPGAAQGERLWQDDTAVRRLAGLQANRELIAAAQAPGLATPTDRPGLHPTALVVQGGAPPAILSDASRRHAGAHLQALRDHRAAGLAKPLARSAALASNAVAPAAALLRCHGLAPGRRQGSDVAEGGPHECQVVFEVRRQVCDHDEQARPAPLSPEARLAYHPESRQPLMDGLQGGLATPRDAHLVEPNGARGQALVDLPRPWDTRRRFFSVPGAPLDKQLAARVWPLCMRQRNNSLFYQSTPSADMASVRTSLIATGLDAGGHAGESLVAWPEHRREVCAAPAAWRPGA